MLDTGEGPSLVTKACRAAIQAFDSDCDDLLSSELE